MSTSIHFQGTVYNKKMSIYPIINYPIFSENTIICKFRDTDTCLSKCDSRAQLEPGQTAPPRQVQETGGRPHHHTPHQGEAGPGPQEAGDGGVVGSVVVGVGVLGEVSGGEVGGGRLAVSGQ